METSSSVDTYEELRGEEVKQKISSTGGTCLLSVIHNLVCDCMLLGYVHFQVTKCIMFYKVNHS